MMTLFKHCFVGMLVAGTTINCARVKKGAPAPIETVGVPPAPGSCPSSLATQCDQTRANIATLSAQRDQALAQKNVDAAARLSLEINHQNEVLGLLTSGITDQAKYAALTSKYQQLAQLLDEAMLCRLPEALDCPSMGNLRTAKHQDN